MKTSKRIAGLLVSLALVCLVSPALKAQGEAGSSGTGTSASVTDRVEALEKEIQSLQAEIAALKKQLSGAPSATSALAVTTAPAAPVSSAGQAPAPVLATVNAPGAVPTVIAPVRMQEPAPTPPPSGQAQTPAPSAAPTLASLLGSTSLTGFVDGYYAYNFNHPHSYIGASAQTPLTPLRPFDGPTDQFGLNMIELTLARPPDGANSRLGYNLTFGFGNAMNAVNSTDPGGLGYTQYLKEGYFSYLAPVGKGLQFDFGKFVTQHGAEVIETKDNWNYSRSLLFTYAIPFYHFGLRSKYVFSDKYNFSAYLVNGWNNIIDNNTGKTLGLQLGWNPTKKVGLVQNYMIGPEQTGDNSNTRQLWDTVVTYSPTSKLSLMWNYDYGRGDRIAGLARPVWWSGIAGYIRYAFNDRYALVTRYEYYDDHDGFSTGTAQHVHEFTGTFERKIASHLITRWEFRRDMANQPSLLKGLSPVKDQNTIEGGLVYVFDMREAK